METTSLLRKVTALFLLISLVVFMSMCKKTVDTPGDTKGVPVLTTKNPASVTESTAMVGGFISSDGGAAVTERGVCYSVYPNPTVSDLAVGLGSGVGTFQGAITGLSPNTNYYVRAYALNSAGLAYGAQASFTTLSSTGSPMVTTTPVTSITNISAICGGNVVSSGTATVTTRGVCWSTSQLPSISDAHTSDSSGTGTFTSKITGLIPNTTYYVRAYATNNNGTTYGNQENFKTTGSGGTIPTLTTTAINNITDISAKSGGNITAQGSSSITARGVCWSTSQNPTSTDEHTTDGTGTGIFISNITGLSPSTKYYLRAYATNDAGIAYGDTVSFITAVPAPCPATLTYEGKTYHLVQINSKCWFKENLNVGRRIEGFQNQNASNDTIEKYCYDNLESNCTIYGGLYQWDEMMQGSATPGAQGICPTGWHIPTNDEFIAMADSLGGDTIAGGKMKESGTAHWQTPNNGATNASGFTALPGGFRDIPNKFLLINTSGIIWTSSQGDATIAWYRSLYFSSESLFLYSGQKIAGFSARCVKD